jgi:hypothetical protein
MNGSQRSRTSRPRAASSRKQVTVASETRRDLRAFGKVNASERIVTRRICAAATNISTTAGGLLLATTLASSSAASAASDFASYAALFTSYRVKAVKTTLLPYFPVPLFNGVGTVVVPPSIASSEFRGGLGGATYQSIADGAKSRFLSGYKSYALTADYSKDNDAQLWTPTTSAIPAAESYGILAMGTATAATANTAIWVANPEYLIEFRATF